ncbi:hypothetical protein HXX76_014163 [Chlamydomonas incerta]|uniref:Uncharacterized protein n=1 Tax=Chlamydomonas incerta TaxID=51695 RepID=A0A835VRE7_CHLIN|nr:hypothetical protein HXX76_014163 [Chlamydomonas incerta]|eukprot:KAG2425005.1 hypothetical protein HXX76_014163 [Chlamydomonas incerta]
MQRVLSTLSDIVQKTEHAIHLLGRAGGPAGAAAAAAAYHQWCPPSAHAPPHHHADPLPCHREEVVPGDSVQATLSHSTPTSLVLQVVPSWGSCAGGTVGGGGAGAGGGVGGSGIGRGTARALSIEYVEYLQKALALYHPGIMIRRGQPPHELVISCPQPGVLSATLQESLKRWLEAPALAYAFDNVRATFAPGPHCEAAHHESLSTMMNIAPWRLATNSALHVWVKDIRAMERIANFKRVRASDDALADLSSAGALMPFPWQISVHGGDNIWRVLNHCGRTLPRVAGQAHTHTHVHAAWDGCGYDACDFGNPRADSAWNNPMNSAGFSQNGQ